MCEKCDEHKRQEEIFGCKKCSSGKGIRELNHLVDDTVAEIKRIDEETKKQHQEAIKDYDNQLAECLQDMAKFATKMLIMFEDYMKKGDMETCVNILQAINNYAILTRTTASIASTSIEMLINRVRNS